MAPPPVVLQRKPGGGQEGEQPPVGNEGERIESKQKFVRLVDLNVEQTELYTSVETRFRHLSLNAVVFEKGKCLLRTG